MQAVVFEVKDRHMVGYASPNGYRYCCTKELVSKTKCHQDRLILQVHSPLCYDHRHTRSMKELARLQRTLPGSLQGLNVIPVWKLALWLHLLAHQ